MNDIGLTSPGRWIYLFSGISRKNKKILKRYWSKVYPRSFVDMLVSAVEERNVQSKKSERSN